MLCYADAVSETLSVRLPDDLAEALRRESRESGTPKGEIVRQAITERLTRDAAVSTIARHFGTVRGPRDLSTNKAYRRAWHRKERV